MSRLTAKDFAPQLLELYDYYAHGRISRREFLDRAAVFAAGVSALSVLGALSPNYALAEQVALTDPAVVAEYIIYPSPKGHGQVRGYLARPANAKGKVPAVVVVHENRGLNPYIEDVARRLAKQGYRALAPDGLSSVGGYPADCFGAQSVLSGTSCPEYHEISDPSDTLGASGAQDALVSNGSTCQQVRGNPEILTCSFGKPDGERAIDVALVGDSHAGMWASALDAISVDRGLRVTMYTNSACPVTLDSRMMGPSDREVLSRIAAPRHPNTPGRTQARAPSQSEVLA